MIMKLFKHLLSAAILTALILSVTAVFFKFRNIEQAENPESLFPDSSTEAPPERDIILVNADNPIPQGYEPELMQLSNGIFIDSSIYPDLQQMFDDARAEGVYPVVGEGYRTHEEQQAIMQSKIDSFISEGYSESDAQNLAEDWVAEPGKSEHELGLALDINAEPDLSTDWEVYEWLAGNAYKYGFILRYPQGKEHITGIDYEPWHYRYVGAEAALDIYTSELTLEEYISWGY